MNCPYCDFDGRRIALHAHLMENHPGEVERDGTVYRFGCPRCDETGAVDVAEGADVTGDEAAEYAREARLKSFDVLLDHLESEHQDRNNGV